VIPSHRFVTLACSWTSTPTLMLRCSPRWKVNTGGGAFFGRVRLWPLTVTVNDTRILTTEGTLSGPRLGLINVTGTATATAATTSNNPDARPMILALRRRMRPATSAAVKRAPWTRSAVAVRRWRRSCSSRTIGFNPSPIAAGSRRQPPG
jgi:hypothetical protein